MNARRDLLLARILQQVSGRARGRRGRDQLTFGVGIAEGTLTHVGQLDGALAAGIHEPVATLRMEFCRCNDLGQFFHVGGFDVHNVEALVLNVQVPQVYSQVIRRDKGLSIAVHRNAVDVVGMGVGIRSTRDSSHDSIVMCHSRQLQVGGALELEMVSHRCPATTWTSGSQFVREIVLGDDL